MHTHTAPGPGAQFELVDGGRRVARIRMLVFDADVASGDSMLGGEPVLSAEEAALLGRLERAGVALVCVTCASEARAQELFAPWGFCPLVLADERSARTSSGRLGSGAARVDALLSLRGGAPAKLRECCVIASRPSDCELLLEAGVAFALAGAGYRARAVADELFPARSAGGLALALTRAFELLGA